MTKEDILLKYVNFNTVEDLLRCKETSYIKISVALHAMKEFSKAQSSNRTLSIENEDKDTLNAEWRAKHLGNQT